MTENTTGRCRMNLAQTAKGLVTFDVTAEYETPEETQKNLSDALDRVIATCKEKGLTLAGHEG